MFEIIKHYRNEDALRASFNQLALKTFGIDFEPWYQRGFWTERYDPYSVVENGRVIANVSVNHMDMHILGERKKLIQLGTVMTDPQYRSRGLIRMLMEEIRQEFADADGMFLFANDSVLEFYPKFGFRKGTEYEYRRPFSSAGTCRMEQVPMDDPQKWAMLRKAMVSSCFQSGCDMLDNPGLMFFYIFDDLSDCVYYSRELDAWVIARLEEQTLHILQIFSKNNVSIDAVAEAFGGGIQWVKLGFAPEDPEGWEKQILQEQDSTFFVKGSLFTDFEARKLRIPILGRA